MARAASKPVRITASFYPMYIATINVTKGIPGVEVRNLTKPMTGCLHDYSCTTDDMKQLAKTDIFVVNGAGMESFLDKVIKQLPNIRIVNASDGIELIKDAEGGNPHVWVSVSLHIKQVRNIASQLAKADPQHAKEYGSNAAAYVAKLEKLRKEMHEGLKGLKTRDIITFHEAFPYFAKEFGLRIAAVIEREPGSEPNAKELAQTITIVKKAKVKALFAEPQYPAKAAQTIARETGAKLYVLDPAVTGPMKDDAYIQIMAKNLGELRKALK
jgi:zinc transport system substrate-binding protein